MGSGKLKTGGIMRPLTEYELVEGMQCRTLALLDQRLKVRLRVSPESPANRLE